MADIVRAQTENLPITMETRYMDMGDGTHAPIMAAVLVGAPETGDNPGQCLIDEITMTLTVISVAHREVHDGETYSVDLFGLTVPDDGNIAILLRTQTSRYAHLTFTVTSGGNARARLLEGVTVNLAGMQLTINNMKRYSTNSAQVVASANPTYMGGRVVTDFFVPGGTGGNSDGGVVRQNTEWILALNTDYVIDLTNIAGNVQPLSIVAQWSEEATP